MTTPLAQTLKARIAATGPVPVADYMAACLSHPEHGYYRNREPFGPSGDFITAPEISQMFGELIGAFCLSAFEKMGAPARFHLIELGPGRGTLMADLLRTARLQPAFLAAATLHLVETSPRLRAIQASSLSQAPLEPRFHDSISTLPDGPLLIVANEFFDALPIHQFIKTPSGWRERLVGLDHQGELTFGIGAAFLPEAEIPRHARAASDGSILETQPASNAICAALSERIANQGGVALFIDYGYTQGTSGDTLQALYKHAFDPVLAHPGEADLTAHVNFEALARSARIAGAMPFAPITQSQFLLGLGLLERAGALGAGKSPALQTAIRDAVERLAAPDQMGDLFKVLAISQDTTPLPPFDKIWTPPQ
ncbi:TetR family transcriptional regulator [Roseibium aquae]|uniref:TetR family transcriptional regulator n=1 Tax=Roseibium aquae TaxID=1323746 RepID=A0A916T7W7_9HYPH|nr:class I SAM-dependent methyltransferase [Roseibium aquae]GGB35016.1 TetR family transcriptional regulator [Roseibium aquae]